MAGHSHHRRSTTGIVIMFMVDALTSTCNGRKACFKKWLEINARLEKSDRMLAREDCSEFY